MQRQARREETKTERQEKGRRGERLVLPHCQPVHLSVRGCPGASGQSTTGVSCPHAQCWPVTKPCKPSKEPGQHLGDHGPGKAAGRGTAVLPPLGHLHWLLRVVEKTPNSFPSGSPDHRRHPWGRQSQPGRGFHPSSPCSQTASQFTFPGGQVVTSRHRRHPVKAPRRLGAGTSRPSPAAAWGTSPFHAAVGFRGGPRKRRHPRSTAWTVGAPTQASCTETKRHSGAPTPCPAPAI